MTTKNIGKREYYLHTSCSFCQYRYYSFVVFQKSKPYGLVKVPAHYTGDGGGYGKICLDKILHFQDKRILQPPLQCVANLIVMKQFILTFCRHTTYIF